MSMSHSEISMTVVEKLSLWSWYESFNRGEVTRARDHDHGHSRRSHLAWRPHISHQMVQLLDRGLTGAGTGHALDRLDSPLLSCTACVRRWHLLQRSSLARQVTTQMADRLTDRSYPSSVSGVQPLSLATAEPPSGPEPPCSFAGCRVGLEDFGECGSGMPTPSGNPTNDRKVSKNHGHDQQTTLGMARVPFATSDHPLGNQCDLLSRFHRLASDRRWRRASRSLDYRNRARFWCGTCRSPLL
jgi:hypothetical protein